MKTIAYLPPAGTRMIDLRRSLPSLHSSLSPGRSATAIRRPALRRVLRSFSEGGSSTQESEERDRLAQLADAQEAARGIRRLFLATLLFWAALYGWYLCA